MYPWWYQLGTPELATDTSSMLPLGSVGFPRTTRLSLTVTQECHDALTAWRFMARSLDLTHLIRTLVRIVGTVQYSTTMNACEGGSGRWGNMMESWGN